MTRYNLIKGQKVPFTPEEEAARDAEEAAWAAGAAERNLEELREQRNKLLAETDWWAGSDHTMTDAQTIYRQALRDITNTYNNLDDVDWPEKP